jgi:hypothetical protein
VPHGLVEGRLTRLLHDAGRLDDPGGRMARALSPAASSSRAAAWIEGFLTGGALLLIHDTALLSLLDAWLAGLRPEAFTEVLPLLRRTFSAYSRPERRTLAARLRDPADPAPTTPAEDLDPVQAAPALATVLSFLPLRSGGPVRSETEPS